MKQINDCLNRFFARQSPLKKKWSAHSQVLDNGSEVLLLYHYHHLVLVYHIQTNRVLHQWWERQADKRGLDAALAYLERRHSCLDEQLSV